jgi:hypothetical protein
MAILGSLRCAFFHFYFFSRRVDVLELSPLHLQDVDLLVLQPPSRDPDTPFRTAEEIKALIVDTDPRRFYLKHPRDPEAPYRILYYRQEYLEADCKVDILTPGTMYLPNIPLASLPRRDTLDSDTTSTTTTSSPVPLLATTDAPPALLTINPVSPLPRSHITTISGIPLVPFSLLLLHKLQGWADHRDAPEEHKRRKHPQDAADVRRLLAMEEKVKELSQSQPWDDMELFFEEFQELTRTRVKDYCKEFPTRAKSWQLLGFETS